MLKTLALALLPGLMLLAATATAEDPKPPAYPDSVGPFVGDWKGLWVIGEEKHPEIAAQVVALGGDAYQILLVPFIYARTPPFATVQATVKDGSLQFDDGTYYGRIEGDVFLGGRRGEDEGTFELKRFVLEPPSMGAAPPEGAIVLFDGSGFEEWERFPRGKSWDILEGGVLQANPDIGYIVSKRDFTACKLHIEFRIPFLPEERGQERGNSGLFLQRFYEVQILDSYGLPGYWNDCGAIYQISAPHVNMCLPPLQWQTYDIEFHGARYDEAGSITENARMTVIHNGVPVQKDIEMTRGTSGDAKKPPVAPPNRPEPIRLQAHKNHVQFRNIWVVDLSDQP
jgi:hypothetical protein